MEEETEIPVILTQHEAWAIAQFFKRVGSREYRLNAIDDDEARVMIRAGEKIRDSLADKEFSPR